MIDTRSAAVLIDFENIYYFLKKQLPTAEDPLDVLSGIVQRLKRHITEQYGEHAISLDAYADFDRIEEAVQSDLYLLGVETHNVLGTDHKNAADMKLCIDALDIMHTRQDIHSFVLVAGDRDYIPLIQYLKKRGKTVRVVGFAQKNVSGDLLTIVGEEFFIDAIQFVPALQRANVLPAGPTTTPAQPPRAASGSGSEYPKEPSDYEPFDSDKFAETALEILVRNFGEHHEIWLVPYLNKLRSELPELTDPERKAIVSRLKEEGAFRIEKRAGIPNDYSVILLNRNSPLVQRAHP